MSVLNQSGEEQVECPLCMEPLEVDDLHFYPCTCGYQICRFCWNRIREGENGLCPACRKAYPENPADFTPLSQEQVAAIKTEKKAREQKRRNKTLESRRALANVRVVQNNLVFVVGLPVRLADPEILKRQEYFGKYGKIHKVVINQSTAYAGSQGPSASAYVTYVSSADALRAIQGVNNVTLDGRVLKGSLGTTKYCANFMKNQPCPKPDCMYLHELGDPKASFTKEEMHAGLHQVYERNLHNQLQQATRDTPTDKQYNSSGNSSTSAEKSSSKDGNQSNNVPTAAVTSPNINVVNSSKSKKESMNGSSQSSSSSGSDKGSKEAWPSLGSSPPSDSPARKLPSPKPQSTHKSQENGTSESSSPTQLTQQAQTNTKSNKDYTDKSRSKDSTNPQPSKKSKSDKKKSNSITDIEDDRTDKHTTQTNNTVFETDSHQYLSNELDELESDRHSLLENHDLLDNSDHNLLEDDNTHNLLSDGNNDVMMMLRHKEMFAGLVENNHMPQVKHINGYGLLDRDTISYLGNDRQISQKIPMPKSVERDLRREEMNRSEMLMRQNEMLRQRAMEHKHYLPGASIAIDSASEMLGANYHPNHSMLPPFGVRVDNSMGTSSLGMANTLPNSLGNMSSNMANMSSNMANMSSNMANNMSNNMSNNMANMANNLPNGLVNSLQNNLPNNMNNMNSVPNNMNSIPAGFMLHSQMLNHQQQQQQQQQMQQNALINGYDAPQASEGRYLAENMDKFFTDFHKAQQRRLLLSREEMDPQQMFAARHLLNERREMEHKQRMNNMRVAESGGRAAGDGDDDLDFDPFKETQKALQEMMETELMQGGVSSGDNMERVRRSRLPPPGFSHVSGFQLQQQQPRLHHQQGYNGAQNSSFSDWTQMDPAIMSTSVNLCNSVPPQASLSHQHQELFAKFNQLNVQNKPLLPPAWQLAPPKLPLWGGAPYSAVPLPPGFAPAKPAQHPAECIDAK